MNEYIGIRKALSTLWEELKTGVVLGQVAFFVAIPLDLWPGDDGGDGEDGDPRDGVDHVDDERDEDIICITGELLRSFQRLEMLWEKSDFQGSFHFSVQFQLFVNL